MPSQVHQARGAGGFDSAPPHDSGSLPNERPIGVIT